MNQSYSKAFLRKLDRESKALATRIGTVYVRRRDLRPYLPCQAIPAGWLCGACGKGTIEAKKRYVCAVCGARVEEIALDFDWRIALAVRRRMCENYEQQRGWI